MKPTQDINALSIPVKALLAEALLVGFCLSVMSAVAVALYNAINV